MEARLKVTLRRSPIGYNETQKRTAKALGLNKLNDTRIHPDNDAIRGMIRRVMHLVSVETVNDNATGGVS